MAYMVATGYHASHPLLDSDECRSIAGLAITKAATRQVLTAPVIRSAVNNALRSELRRETHQAERFVSIGDEEGPALNSVLDLRGAPSLNPRAADLDGSPHGKGFMLALDEVCSAAALQVSSDPAYAGKAAVSRDIVHRSQTDRARQYQVQQHNDLRALKRAA